MWDARQYLKFSNERSRAFLDLMSQVQRSEVGSIADLGCGPGLLTRTLAERWPMAQVIGVDNAPAMLQQARELAIPQRLDFVQADLAEWTPEAAVDLIVSNAALHWVGDHENLLRKLAGKLSPSGILAVQMPNSFGNPSHVAVEETMAQPRWQAIFQGTTGNREHVQPLEWYVQKLLEMGFTVDAWETTYVHILHGENPVLDWLKGTTLRPLLDQLEPPLVSEFLAELGGRLLQAYPAQGSVTLFPFRRLFFYRQPMTLRRLFQE